MIGSNAKQNKALNLRLVLAQIVALGPISRVEIARNTHLTKQTITNMVEALLAHNLVTEVGIKKSEGAGKPSKMLCLNETAAYSVAVRVTNTELHVALFKLNGECINSLHTQCSHSELLEKTAYLVNTLLNIDNINKSQVLGVGFSMQDSAHLALESHLTAQKIQQDLAQQLALPIAIETSAAAAAAYQMLFGEAKELHNFIYVHLGNRVEAAVVYDRKILLGQNGLTGAIGDIFVTPETDDKTGELGRLNDFVSLQSLKAQLKDTKLTQDMLLSELNEENKIVLNWVDTAEEPLRIAIHTLESLLNTQTIILGGDINDWLLDKLLTQLRPYIPSIAQYGERNVIRLIKTPDVSQIAMKGLATLPLHAALSFENMQTLYTPDNLAPSDLQSLIYG